MKRSTLYTFFLISLMSLFVIVSCNRDKEETGVESEEVPSPEDIYPVMETNQSENFFDITIHPEDQNYVLATYRYQLESKESADWANIVAKGLELAAQDAMDGDMIAVGIVYQDSSLELVLAELSYFWSYRQGEISQEAFLDSLRIQVISGEE